jgi:iron complex transport system substrate-binding protein
MTLMGVLGWVAVAAALSCERPSSPAANPPAQAKPTVASLVPAASDLIDAMGARDQLVAVSNYDADPIVQDLPRVGDYQNADWERLQQLRPGVMVIFQDPARVSEGWKQRAAELNIMLVNVRTETLENIYQEASRLGDLLQQSSKADALVAQMKRQLDEVHSSSGSKSVRTLVFMGSGVDGVVGRGNFINDVLEIAGGENVVQTNGWPTMDREQLRALAPDAVIVLLSGVPEHVEAEARRNVMALTELPAVQHGRVFVINEWYAHISGSRVVQLAQKMAAALHSSPATMRSGDE